VKIINIAEIAVFYRSGGVKTLLNRRFYNPHIRHVSTPPGVSSSRNFYGLAVL